MTKSQARALVLRAQRTHWRAPRIGGLADGRLALDFPRDALIQGVLVELEHTSDPWLALRITMDHLVENLGYYKALAKMEKQLERKPNAPWTVNLIHLDSFGRPQQDKYAIGVLEGRELLGVLEFSVFEGVAHVDWIEVYPPYRRRGVARALYHRLYQWARQERVQVKHGMLTEMGSAALQAMKPELEQYRVANPLVPRIQHVAKSYPDFVVMATLAAWAEATGQHDLMEQAARIFYDGNESSARVLVMLPKLMKDWRAPEETPYDRYLPWAAREFNRIYKPYKQLVKREAGSKWEPLPAFPLHFDIARFVLTRNVGRRYIGILGTLRDEARSLRNNFGAIANWAMATNTDLNRYTWQQAITAAEKWAEERAIEQVPQGKIVYRFEDGWTVQELGTATDMSRANAELKAEGDIMQHCVGGYDPRRIGKDYRIFSLRDPRGLPHTTMEWDPDERYVVQLRGKQNDEPRREYLERMMGFRENVLDPLTGWKPYKQKQPVYEGLQDTLMGAYKDAKGDVHYLFQDPDGRPHLYTEADLNKVFDWAVDYLERNWTYEGLESEDEDEDEDGSEDFDEAYNEAYNEVLSSISLSKLSGVKGLWLHEGPVPESLQWRVLVDHRIAPHNTEDEMIHWMTSEGKWSPQCRFLGQRAANRGRSTRVRRRGRV